MSKGSAAFSKQATEILTLPIEHRVNALGGYGPSGAVVYDGHPFNCPSVLVDNQKDATLTLMSNGSVGFVVATPGEIEVPVLDSSFDPVEKREISVPSSNVWFTVNDVGGRRIASLMNPRNNVNCEPERIRLVKLGDPSRAMWYCAWFRTGDAAYETAVKLSLVTTGAGPAMLRQIYVKNTGSAPLDATLWTCLNLHGTQRFVYNKQLWYDVGMPITDTDVVVTATVPYSTSMQIKRVSSAMEAFIPAGATCDYASFMGDTSMFALLPEAVRTGDFVAHGSGASMNRFTTAAIAASKFAVALAPGEAGTVQQSLLYVTDGALAAAFRNDSASDKPGYPEVQEILQAACSRLLAATPDAADAVAMTPAATEAKGAPYFELAMPKQRAVAEYANSVWTTVKELYENCRAHGATLADGIELGTRDRGQDMWPKLKEDPGRVRADLVHVMGFMYVTQDGPIDMSRPLTLPEKLHGMFPRQYPSRWKERGHEVYNDNRPYTDSPLWLINSLVMYIRETGDTSILLERVKSIRLITPETPETSAIVGCDREFAVIEVVLEILACFKRHADDSPYGLAQILYGDWCDPIDMFGTKPVGNDKTRGHGRGVQVRLSAHLFEVLSQVIDLLRVEPVAAQVAQVVPANTTQGLATFAQSIRANIVKWAWEPSDNPADTGFIDVIHELKADGSVPNYAAGEMGYTLGSTAGKEFDGANRRIMTTQAYVLNMLMTQRDYLPPLPDAQAMIDAILAVCDTRFFSETLGLTMISPTIANSETSRRLVGRMGVVPAGCAENGEYHHGQVFMHRFRLPVPGQADTMWTQFKPIISAMRDTSLGGPFETPCTSYVSDKDDPHFGEGMYFGLSGSIDWIVEIFHQIVGLTLNLHDPNQPDIAVVPNLPAQIEDTVRFSRVVHVATGPGQYKQVPLTIDIRREGEGKALTASKVVINGESAESAEIASVAALNSVVIEIVRVYA